MLVVMRQNATPEEIRGVEAAVEARGWKAHAIPGGQRTAIGITGNPGAVEAPVFESLPGVLEVIPVTHAYKLVSREVKAESSVVRIGSVRISRFPRTVRGCDEPGSRADQAMAPQSLTEADRTVRSVGRHHT